jgi:hypothetical protein
MATYRASEPQKAKIYFVEPDVYEVEIRKAIESISIKSGNSMIKLTCAIIMPDSSDGPEVWEYLTFTENAAWKIDQVLAAIGYAVVIGEEVDVDPDKLVGKKGICLIGQEAGKENPDHRFNKIDRWFFGDEKKKWLSGEKSSLPVEKAKPAQVAPKKQVEVYEDADGDEIPF